MADTSAKRANHITRCVQEVTSLLDNIKELKALAQEAADLGYADLDKGLQDGDFAGANGHLTAAQYRQVLSTFAGLDAQLSDSRAGPSVFSILQQVRP